MTVTHFPLLTQHFKIGAHVGERAPLLSDAPNLVHIHFASPSRVAQRFDGDIDADFGTAFEAIDYGSRDAGDVNRHAVDHVILNTKGQGLAIDAENSEPHGHARRDACLAADIDPDLVWQLRREAMEAER